MNQVVIIIVNWNTGELLARCLASLADLPDVSRMAEIIVVDNASRDRSLVRAQVVVGEHGNNPPVRFIKSERNLGFARANNLAIARAAASHPLCDVLFLNPDTAVLPGSLEAMLGVFERKKDAGIVGPKLVSADGVLQPSVRAFPTLAVFVFFWLKLHRLLPGATLWRRYQQTDFAYEREQAVDQVMGAAMLVRREMLTSIGLFDERFWLWFEEVDLCKRARTAGWQVVYTPQATVLHHGAVSFHQLFGLRRALPWCMSSRRYAAKHLGRRAAAVLGLLLPAALALAVPSALIHWLTWQKRHRL